MKFLPLFILSAAAGTAFAQQDDGDNGADDMGMGMGWGDNKSGGGGRKWGGNSTVGGGGGPRSQCRQLAQLTQLTSYASDPTKLSDLPPDKAAALQAQASQAATQLTALQSNATLMSSCSSYLTEQEMHQQCRTMAKLEKLTAMVNNQTLLAPKTDGDAEKEEKFKTMAKDSAQELASLQGNSTLTAYCSVLETMETCKVLKKLEKMVERTGNGTSSSGGGGGGRFHRGGKNETSSSTTGIGGDGDNAEDAGGNESDKTVGKWEAKLAEKKTWLEQLKSNTTLVEMCAAMDSSDNKDSPSNGGQGGDSAPDPGVITAGAERTLQLRPLGNMVVSLATVLLFSLLVL